MFFYFYFFIFFYSGKKIHCTIIIEFEQGETKPQAAYLFPILGYNNVEVSMQRLVGKKHGMVEIAIYTM